jgi:putative aminopeptidase FrvX
MDIKNCLLILSETDGVSGNENEVTAILKDILINEVNIPESDIKIDKLGNLIVKINPSNANGEHILLDAHIDQIGMIVTSIDENGFLRAANCGGVDRRTLLACEVIIHGKSKLKGVFCCQPPHLLSKDDYKKVLPINELAIDIGFNGETAKERVVVGDIVTLDRKPIVMQNDKICGKSLDNRAGAVSIIRAIELIKDKNINIGLTAVFSVQEEVGLRGAGPAAYGVSPTKAIVVDVSYAFTPDSPREKCGDIDKGPMIGIAATLSREMYKELCNIAQQKDIPYQTEVMAEKTGTNSDAISISREGVEVGLLSIPLKYMHTSVEIISMQDIEHTAELIAEYVLQM